MSSSKLPPESLLRGLREIAAADAPELLAEARARARIRAEALIEDALVEELVATAARLHNGHSHGRPDVGPEAGAPPADHARSADDARPARDVRRLPDGGSENGRSAGGQVWWTYCVASTDDIQLIPSELEGIEAEGRVEVVREGALAALVSPVPASEYGDERLREHLEDLAWLERIARRHEAVLDEVLNEATIVPLRLCTLYRDRSGVRGFLRDYARSLLEGLSRIGGCTEWGVKVFADARAGGVPDPGEAGVEASGAAYLQQRQQERVLAERAAEVRAKCAEAVHRRLTELAREAVSNPPQRPEVHGRDLRMLLNGAYLVQRGREDELARTVDVLREEWEPLGFVVELTGPWPPYNFASAVAGVMP